MKIHILSLKKKHCTFISVLFCSFISFIYTDPKSPDDLEDTCFDIDNTSVSKMHFGNYFKIYFYFIWNLNHIFYMPIHGKAKGYLNILLLLIYVQFFVVVNKSGKRYQYNSFAKSISILAFFVKRMPLFEIWNFVDTLYIWIAENQDSTFERYIQQTLFLLISIR